MQKTAFQINKNRMFFHKKMILSQKVARIVRFFFGVLFTSEIFIY